jgi:hypothetical protein
MLKGFTRRRSKHGVSQRDFFSEGLASQGKNISSLRRPRNRRAAA